MEKAYKVLYLDEKNSLWSYCKQSGIPIEFQRFARRYYRTKWNHAKKENIKNGYGLLVFDNVNSANTSLSWSTKYRLFEVEVDKLYCPSPKLTMLQNGITFFAPFPWPEHTKMCNKLRIVREIEGFHK